MPFDEAAAAAHVREAVLATPLAVEPFAHLLIADLYPDDVYDGIMTMWPELDLFRRSNSQTRYEFNFHVGHKTLPKEDLEFWRKVTRVTNIANLTIQQRLSPRFGEKFRAVYRYELGVGGRRQRRLSGYLAPTRDLYQRFRSRAACGLAASADQCVRVFLGSGREGRGTGSRHRALQIKGGSRFRRTGRWSARRRRRFLDRAVVSPFQRNHCLAYVNSPISFHGVDEVDIGARHRRLLMFGFGDLRAGSAADHGRGNREQGAERDTPEAANRRECPGRSIRHAWLAAKPAAAGAQL